MNQKNESSDRAGSGHAIYDSAIDLWVKTMLVLPSIIAVVIGVFCLVEQRYDDATILFVCGAVITLITVACTLPCRYTMTEDSLSIRCGLILFYRVRYADIESTEPSRSWKSGPALSMKRVAIKTQQKTILVSPANHDEFLRDLNERIETSR